MCFDSTNYQERLGCAFAVDLSVYETAQLRDRVLRCENQQVVEIDNEDPDPDGGDNNNELGNNLNDGEPPVGIIVGVFATLFFIGLAIFVSRSRSRSSSKTGSILIEMPSGNQKSTNNFDPQQNSVSGFPQRFSKLHPPSRQSMQDRFNATNPSIQREVSGSGHSRPSNLLSNFSHISGFTSVSRNRNTERISRGLSGVRTSFMSFLWWPPRQPQGPQHDPFPDLPNDTNKSSRVRNLQPNRQPFPAMKTSATSPQSSVPPVHQQTSEDDDYPISL